MAVAGVVTGFVIAEKILAKKGFRRVRRRTRVTLVELPEYLQKKYLVRCAVITENGKKILRGVYDDEIEDIRKKLEIVGSNEVLLIDDSNYTYAVERNGKFIFVRGKFISVRDFSEVWMLIQSSLKE